jgi:hypothetical protein
LQTTLLTNYRLVIFFIFLFYLLVLVVEVGLLTKKKIWEEVFGLERLKEKSMAIENKTRRNAEREAHAREINKLDLLIIFMVQHDMNCIVVDAGDVTCGKLY